MKPTDDPRYAPYLALARQVDAVLAEVALAAPIELEDATGLRDLLRAHVPDGTPIEVALAAPFPSLALVLEVGRAPFAVVRVLGAKP